MPRDYKEPNYEVGYGKPPHQTRFKPGCSGNPRGRPKDAKNLSTLVHEALNEPVVVAENGRRRKISKRQAIIAQLVNRSAQADFKATQIVLGLLRDIESRGDPGTADQPAFTEADQEIIQQIKARLRDQLE